MRRPVKMSADQYRLVADAISKIADVAMRESVTAHFCRYFNERSKMFEPVTFERACLGHMRLGNQPKGN